MPYRRDFVWNEISPDPRGALLQHDMFVPVLTCIAFTERTAQFKTPSFHHPLLGLFRNLFIATVFLCSTDFGIGAGAARTE